MIKLKEAILQIRSGQPFDLEVCSLDINRKTGGERKVYTGAILSTAQPRMKQTEGAAAEKQRRYHGTNLTMNIALPNGDIETIHTPLIESFNHNQVIL